MEAEQLTPWDRPCLETSSSPRRRRWHCLPCIDYRGWRRHTMILSKRIFCTAVGRPTFDFLRRHRSHALHTRLRMLSCDISIELDRCEDMYVWEGSKVRCQVSVQWRAMVEAQWGLLCINGWNKEVVGGSWRAKYGVACVGTMALYLFTSEGRFKRTLGLKVIDGTGRSVVMKR